MVAVTLGPRSVVDKQIARRAQGSVLICGRSTTMHVAYDVGAGPVVTVPPAAFTTSRTIAKPKPDPTANSSSVPKAPLVAVVVTNGSNSVSATSGAIPSPLSANSIFAPPSGPFVNLTRMRPKWPALLTALIEFVVKLSRLRTTLIGALVEIAPPLHCLRSPW